MHSSDSPENGKREIGEIFLLFIFLNHSPMLIIETVVI